MGIVCNSEGKEILIGNRKLLNEKNVKIDSDVEEKLTQFEAQGKT
jgi:cation transport ATPase